VYKSAGVSHLVLCDDISRCIAFSTMRRAIRNLLGRNSDEKGGQAATTEDATDAVDESHDDTAFSLDVWVQGVNPLVEYVSLIVLCLILLFVPLSLLLLRAANRHVMTPASSQYMASTVTEKRPGRPRTT
jgi:hypothetical protein